MPEIIYRKPKELKLHDRNPRQIAAVDFTTLCESIERHPDYFEGRPILLSDRTGDLVVIAGNMRLRASKKLGLKQVPTMLLPGLTEEREREIIIRDNVNNGEWDLDILSADYEFPELQEWGLSFPEFEADAVEPEGDADAEPQMDKAAELNKKWKVKSGDLWQIGNHRLVCGDSTSPQAVERVLDGAKPNLMITDPPYGVEYDAEWREGADLGVGERSKGKVLNDDRDDWSEAYRLFNGDVAYVWHASLRCVPVGQHLIDCGFDLRYQIIWKKQHFALSRGHYHWQHEPCWYVVRQGQTSHWISTDRTQASVWDISNNNSFGHEGAVEETFGHSTQKPLECMARPIRNHEGDVYEPFAGSGTTLVACQNLGRKCYAIEISESYCAVILERLQTAFPDIEIKRIEDAKGKANN